MAYTIAEEAVRFRHPDYNPDRAQKLISSSMSRHLPSRSISSKSMHEFLSNLANRQTDRQTRANAFTSSFVGGNWRWHWHRHHAWIRSHYNSLNRPSLKKILKIRFYVSFVVIYIQAITPLNLTDKNSLIMMALLASFCFCLAVRFRTVNFTGNISEVLLLVACVWDFVVLLRPLSIIHYSSQLQTWSQTGRKYVESQLQTCLKRVIFFYIPFV